MKCCDQIVKTQFCPHCGKKQKFNTLHKLVAHCWDQHVFKERKITGFQKLLDEGYHENENNKNILKSN